MNGKKAAAHKGIVLRISALVFAVWIMCMAAITLAASLDVMSHFSSIAQDLPKNSGTRSGLDRLYSPSRPYIRHSPDNGGQKAKARNAYKDVVYFKRGKKGARHIICPPKIGKAPKHNNSPRKYGHYPCGYKILIFILLYMFPFQVIHSPAYCLLLHRPSNQTDG